LPQLLNNTERYGWVSRAFHWAIAGLILGLIWLGWWMVDLSFYDAWYHASLTWHKSLGLVVLVLALAKVIWHRRSTPPPLGDTLTSLERVGARSVHRMLLALMFIIPITGYIITTSDGKPVDMFGLFEIPALLSVTEMVRDNSIFLHYWLAYGTIALVGLHAAAALKHQFINRDGILRRMI